MRKRKIIKTTLLVLLAFAVLALNLVCLRNAYSQLNNRTQLNYNRNSEISPKTISEYEELLTQIPNDRITFLSEQKAVKVKAEEVTPTLTDHVFFEVFSPKMKGEFFKLEQVQSGDKLAVIESSLALKLYFTEDALGKYIELGDEKYKICGIIESNNSLINGFSSDGKQRVYIPYTAYENYESAKIQTISYDNKSFAAPILEQMDIKQYHFTNLWEKSSLLLNFEHLIFLSLFVAFSAIALKFWKLKSKKLLGEIKLDLSVNYFKSSIKAIPKKYLLFGLISVGIPILLIIIFLLCNFSIYIPSRYMPYDNLFDISHYINAIMQSTQAQNALALSGDTLALELYSRTFSTAAILLPIFVILLSIITSKIFKRLDLYGDI